MRLGRHRRVVADDITIIYLALKKLNGIPSKRFVVDFWNLNADTRLTSFPIPSIETVLVAVAEQRPML